jgi:16S rRNA (adenine1518-N6/adenine1519-N6)-dimethyltransferase
VVTPAVPTEPSADQPSQPSLRRMRAFGVRPKRDLGQNFLIDSNILGVIERAAELVPQDVALEIGGGLGVLSEHLAQRTAHTHVVEVDRSLEPPLRDALADHPNTTLHLADALELDLAALDPPPTKVVANLPYGIAATAILNTVFELPSVTRWVAMVQKEVGERFAAQAGTPAYGVPSVLAQLACDVKVLRAVSRTVFHPVPNVDSVLVVLQRTGEAPPPALRALVQGAFAHRRKALARSLELAAKDPRRGDSGLASLQRQAGGTSLRDRARAALADLGLPVDVRAERLTPEQFRALGRQMAVGAA